MWEPIGPLPAAVYWRRRFVAILSTVAVLVSLAWIVAAALAPAEPASTAPGRAAVSAPQQVDPSPVPVEAPGTGGVEAVASESPPPSTSELPATTSEIVLPDNTPRAPVAVPESVPVPPTGPVPCTNEMISVGAEIDEAEHRVGERPTLRLVVVNVSDQPCVRDLDGARQEIVVWSGDGEDRLWSSNDCVNPQTVDLRTLVPGQPVAFSVRWAGRTSTPGCAEERVEVPAGAYRVLTRVDDVISAPAPFLRSP
ncbi:hypothetical protein [Pseudonocardia sp.]|uniref:hypothetical protein n=1 Tax=Pseudonocardia sp. TaxID=60912 RepID=UPI0026136333|nr:hypothetical protein [Pseudonocardia sp.]